MSTLVFGHEFTNFWTSSKALSEIDSTDFSDFVRAFVLCCCNSEGDQRMKFFVNST